MAAPDRPIEVEAFIDYHCPYSHRAVAWLDALAEVGRIASRYRLFGLEQVNRDPAATAWRLWDQPLDYEHYRGRQDRRPLAAFLATAIIDAAEPADVARRFRLGVYGARFDDLADISDIEVLERAAVAAGAAPDRIRNGLADPDRLEAARRRIADDWARARAAYEIFGVPTLSLDGAAPFYLRLAGHVEAAAGAALLDAIRTFRRAAPDLLELKVPDAIEADEVG
jgi:hypothetical protein